MDFRNRNFLKLGDYSGAEIQRLLDFAKKLKIQKTSGFENQYLKGKQIALIFEKTSTRTRCAFEVAAKDQGAFTTYLGPNDSQLGEKESISDTARVLGKMYDAIQYRGHGQSIVEEIGKQAGVPVYNGLTDEFHPTQVLADFLTMQENCGLPLRRITFAFVGDARSNMANSLMVGAAKMGMKFIAVAPKALWPNEALVNLCNETARLTGSEISLSEDLEEGVKECDFIYTDVWVSMGEPREKWAERISMLKNYQITTDVIKSTGNIHTRFMHCLPAYHNRSTEIGEYIYQQFGLDGVEVTDEVFESKNSLVFEQAENRMHTIKSVLVATLGDMEL